LPLCPGRYGRSPAGGESAPIGNKCRAAMAPGQEFSPTAAAGPSSLASECRLTDAAGLPAEGENFRIIRAFKEKALNLCWEQSSWHPQLEGAILVSLFLCLGPCLCLCRCPCLCLCHDFGVLRGNKALETGLCGKTQAGCGRNFCSSRNDCAVLPGTSACLRLLPLLCFLLLPPGRFQTMALSGEERAIRGSVTEASA